MKKFLFSLLIYGGGIIALGFLAGYPIIGILLALFIIASLYAALLIGQVIGAEFALRNPPPIGETRITFKVFDQEINMSESFPFSPPAPDGQRHNFSINKGGRPKGSLKDGNNMTSFDVMTWHKEAKRILEKQSYQDFVAFCEAKGENEATVRSRIKRYFT